LIYDLSLGKWGKIKLVFAGDAMPSRRLTPFKEPDYTGLVELIRGSDRAFVNLETTVRHRDEGTPGRTRGTRMTTPHLSPCRPRARPLARLNAAASARARRSRATHPRTSRSTFTPLRHQDGN